MKRQLAAWLVAALFTVTLALGTSDAHGRRGSSCCVAAPCYDACAPVCAPAVQYEERQVTAYRAQMVQQTITENVTRCVPVQENYTYTVSVPVMRAEKRMQTVYVQQQKEVQVPVNVCVPVTTNEKRMVTECVPTTRNVEYLYTVMVPETVQRKVLSTTFQCVPRQVTVNVPVCRVVPVTCTDACGNCITTCQRVVENQVVTRTVMERVPVTQEVTINQVVCRADTRKGTRTVTEMVATQKEVVVPVTRMQMQQQMVRRIVCETVAQQQEVTVNVCHYEQRQQQGTRTVHRMVTEPVTRTVSVCQMVPYTTTVRVAVGVAGAGACGGCCR